MQWDQGACVCVCVFNSMCVLECATDRPTPTERWCVVYDFSRESRCILSFPGVPVGTCGQLPRPLLTSLAHPKPLHRPRALPARNGHHRSKESVPHSCPGRADATSHWRKSDGCFVRPTYCWVYVIWRLIGLYYWGGRTTECPTLLAKGGSRLQFSPFLQWRSARAVKTRRLSDYMAHLTLSPYFPDTVRHLTLYIVLPLFLNISLCRD